jgi:hypothetical protein
MITISKTQLSDNFGLSKYDKLFIKMLTITMTDHIKQNDNIIYEHIK